MKADTRHKLGFGSRLRLFSRLLGLTAVVAAVAGFFVVAPILPVFDGNTLRDAFEGIHGKVAQNGMYVLGIGAALVLFCLVIEFLSGLGNSGQRSMTQLNASAQVLIAIAIVAGINVFAFDFFKRWDLTRDKQFTLPVTVVEELRKLKGTTTIAVVQQHKTFGQLSPKPDVYDYAAERKVVEKVKDLVDQFREVGPQFRVVVFDVEAIGYERKLAEETEKRPGLKEAIAAAPENSIIFYADDKVEELPTKEASLRVAQGRRVSTIPGKSTGTVFAFEGNIPRLSFNEFFQLDKTASKEADPDASGKPQGNLVLRPQGVEAFASRVLAIQEKKPKVGLLVIHEWLTTAVSQGGQEQYTASGLRKSLEDHGYEVSDIILKRWRRGSPPTPAVYNREETEFDRREAELNSIESDLREARGEKEQAVAFLEMFREATLEELNKKFRGRIRREIDEEFRKRQIRAVEDALGRMNERLAELEKDRKEIDDKAQALMANERAFEDRRVSDVRAKLTRQLADCDLIVIPRQTLINVSEDELIPPSVHKLSEEQVDVIRDYMKTGKPVLALIGPANDQNNPGAVEPVDDFEKLLNERGIELGRQTVLFDGESKGFAARQAGDLLGGGPSDIPAIAFLPSATGPKPNPIAEAMRATARSVEQQLDIRVRHPRPVYLAPAVAGKQAFAGEFVYTANASWNEDNPFPVIRNVGPNQIAISPPRYDATPFDDAKKGTRDEERRGPFPIGVAVESSMPVDWYDKNYSNFKAASSVAGAFDRSLLAAALTASSSLQPDAKGTLQPQQTRKPGRLVVLGTGGVFVGKQLSPAHEQLLLHSCNWLLQREDRLPKTEGEWKYPRADVRTSTAFYWQWGPFLGLPLAFLYLGMIVWIIRKVR